jgi:hypothetical protein
MTFSPTAIMILLIIGIIILVFIQQRFFPAKSFKGDKKSIAGSGGNDSSDGPDDGDDRDLHTAINTLANKINGWNYQRA